MADSIKSIFDRECSNLKIDLAFYKKICELEARFVNKRQEHIEFFGGTLTGVQSVRFTDEDRDRLFTDILEIDDGAVEQQVHNLPDIKTERIVSSDIFNIACVWVMHALDNTPYLDYDQRLEGKIRICLYLQYKFLTSKLYNLFRYPADPEIAAAVYAQLSYKYILKAEGSWGAALRYRAVEVVSEHSIHARIIKKLDNDYNVVTMLNDVQGRIRDMLKNIMSLHVKIKDQGGKIQSRTNFIESDGEMIFKDKAHSAFTYVRYIKEIIPDKFSFIRTELQNIIFDIMPTMPEHLLTKSLQWVSDNYNHLNDKSVEKAIEMIMEHAFDYLSQNKTLVKDKGDLSGMLCKLRGAYVSSRSTEASMMQIKETVDEIIRMATKSKNDSVIAATRTGFCLYIILRSFTKSHYQQN